MLNNLEPLLAYLDIPILVILCGIYVYNFCIIDNYENMFISFIISSFLSIIVANLLLNEQIHLGEIILLIILFVFSVLFLLFLLIKHPYIKNITFKRFGNTDLIKYAFMFLVTTASLGFFVINKNFYQISIKKDSIRNIKSLIVSNRFDDKSQIINKKDMTHQDKMILLNKNKIFKRITDIVMLYISGMMIYFFMNRQRGRMNARG